eukprot:NODE_51_length_31136_cov_0.357670.p18 type:complete len:210 gc:universal NODE_51_length_31136_cov_0.357670:28363-27734(-)
MSKILVLGANGATGSATLRQLKKFPEYSVTVLARKPQPADFTGKWYQQENMIPPPEIKPDHVICCIGTTRRLAGSAENFIKIDHDLVIDLARSFYTQNPSSTFSYVSAAGSNANSRILYSRSKGKTENDLLAIGFKQCHIMRPGFLIVAEERPDQRWMESLMNFLIKITPFKKIWSVSVDKVALAMIKLIKTPQSQVIFENKEIHKLAE